MGPFESSLSIPRGVQVFYHASQRLYSGMGNAGSVKDDTTPPPEQSRGVVVPPAYATFKQAQRLGEQPSRGG